MRALVLGLFLSAGCTNIEDDIAFFPEAGTDAPVCRLEANDPVGCSQCGPVPATFAVCDRPCPSIPNVGDAWCRALAGPATCCVCDGTNWHQIAVDCFPPPDASDDGPTDAGVD